MIEEVPTFQGGGHDKTRDERRAILLAQFDGNGCDNCSIGLCAEVDLCAIGHGPRSGQGFNPGKFRLEEARIEDIHRAIKSGQITCEKLVQAYINRIRAYDGMCVAP